MKLSSFCKTIHLFLLDLLFPIHCLGCGKHGDWICEKCFASIPLATEQVCPLCEKRVTPCGQICFDCIGKSALDGLLAISSYQNELVRTAVHHYKYRFIADLHVPLGDLLIKSLAANDLPLPDCLLPVPLHPRRLRWRGFNQAQLLANRLGEKLTPGFPLPVLGDTLMRQKYTQPQMGIKKYQQRQQNIENAFAINNADKIRNATVLLVDDIATTGSTLFECARVLKAAGAKKVFAIVIARQSDKEQKI